MKKLLPFILLITLPIFQFSCEKFDGDLDDPGDYLIFGGYAFECGGNCTNLYQLKNGKLFQDNVDWGLPDNIPFKNTPLDDSKYEIAKVLIDEFPADLLASDKRTYGCPDCGDQGGVYLELKDGRKKNTWLIDNWDDEQNQAIINYKLKIREVLQAL